MLPLVVDLDGTLIRSDLLVESGLTFVRTRPANALMPLVWLASGKAHLKHKLAEISEIDVANLPYDQNVISLINEERAKGRQIVLATATHDTYAGRIAAHLQLFDRVLATDGRLNLSARNKRDRLIEAFGERGFDYVGNSQDDIEVWAAAHSAYVANPERGVEKKVRALGNLVKVISQPAGTLKLWAAALRLHQWAKNLLLFVPLLASHQVGSLDLLLRGVMACFLFGLCASSVYLLNDLVDLADDRHHPTKRYRPLAAGFLPVRDALFAVPFLVVGAFAGAIWLLPWKFAAAMGVYYALTLAYSITLKRMMMVDVVALALLYTLRVVAGTFVFGLTLTFWMLAFSMFMFLSLALVKRYGELKLCRAEGKTGRTQGRGYYASDLEMIASLGAASGYLSVLVLALYIQEGSTAVLYRNPQVIWLACPLLLFWISRAWLLAHRGQVHDDPVVFALKDRVSLLLGALFVAIFWFAT